MQDVTNLYAILRVTCVQFLVVICKLFLYGVR